MVRDNLSTYKTTINASVEKVWEALTNSEIVKQYFFGSNQELNHAVLSNKINQTNQKNLNNLSTSDSTKSTLPRMARRSTVAQPNVNQPMRRINRRCQKCARSGLMGTIPERNLVGRAFFIWMSWDAVNTRIDFSRIGTVIK